MQNHQPTIKFVTDLSSIRFNKVKTKFYKFQDMNP